LTVTVVIVTAGRPDVLARCVRALAAGSRPPDELVVVDQSSDVDAAVEELLAGASFQVRHLRVRPMGVSAGRNLGASHAQGDLLAFTDDDCVPAADWLAELVAALTRHAADGATGAVLPLADDRPGLVAVSSRTDPERRLFDSAGRVTPWEVGTGGNLLLTRMLFDRVGGFDLQFGPGARYRAAEDVDLLDRVLRAGGKIAYEPAAVVFHEMKTPGERLARRYPYGYGLGAMVACAGGGRSRALAAAYGRMQARSLASGIRRRSVTQLAEPLLAVAGFTAGACRALLDARASDRPRPPRGS
jgi:GT2 family glycosyltransferase